MRDSPLLPPVHSYNKTSAIITELKITQLLLVPSSTHFISVVSGPHIRNAVSGHRSEQILLRQGQSRLLPFSAIPATEIMDIKVLGNVLADIMLPYIV